MKQVFPRGGLETGRKETSQPERSRGRRDDSAFDLAGPSGLNHSIVCCCSHARSPALASLYSIEACLNYLLNPFPASDIGANSHKNDGKIPRPLSLSPKRKTKVLLKQASWPRRPRLNRFPHSPSLLAVQAPS